MLSSLDLSSQASYDEVSKKPSSTKIGLGGLTGKVNPDGHQPSDLKLIFRIF
jgi:hypothetical protein